MNLFGTDFKKYWKNRKLDWIHAYSSTHNHPHRQAIIRELKTFPWRSLLEIGCASGPNLIALKKAFPRADLGGIDINEDAIATAKETFKDMGLFFDVGDAEDILMSDESTDVVLTDMALMYLNRRGVKKALREIHRISRKGVVLVELHSTNPIRRLWLRLTSGQHAYNYKSLLSKVGYYDIIIRKITEAEWSGGEPQRTFAYIIRARKL